MLKEPLTGLTLVDLATFPLDVSQKLEIDILEGAKCVYITRTTDFKKYNLTEKSSNVIEFPQIPNFFFIISVDRLTLDQLETNAIF